MPPQDSAPSRRIPRETLSGWSTDVAPAQPPAIVPPYQQFIAAGLLDVWAARHGPAPGFTCCQDTTLQNALLNPASTLTSRIDYIFSRGGGLKATGAQIVGADPGSRSVPGGFWPSDHAGLIAELAQGSPS